MVMLQIILAINSGLKLNEEEAVVLIECDVGEFRQGLRRRCSPVTRPMREAVVEIEWK